MQMYSIPYTMYTSHLGASFMTKVKENDKNRKSVNGRRSLYGHDLHSRGQVITVIGGCRHLSFNLVCGGGVGQMKSNEMTGPGKRYRR